MAKLTRRERRRTTQPTERVFPSGRIFGVRHEPTQDVQHLRCPLCGLTAREDDIVHGPYDPEARMQHFGGSLPSPSGRMRGRQGIMVWDPSEPVNEAQRAMLIKQAQAVLVKLGAAELPELPQPFEIEATPKARKRGTTPKRKTK